MALGSASRRAKRKRAAREQLQEALETELKEKAKAREDELKEKASKELQRGLDQLFRAPRSEEGEAAPAAE